ncbi:MAG: biotin/lipoyl-binding protein, partial [Halioglobus sp.]|nr:biotin/lipoyl-binding protein [Halioglobus sp.]
MVNSDASAKKRLPLSTRRQRQLLWLFIAICLSLFAWWVYQRYAHVTTDDASIAADLIAVSSKTPGRIVTLSVSQGDAVEAGELLARIDDREARFQLRELEAQLQSMQAAHDRAVAEIAMVDQQTGGH